MSLVPNAVSDSSPDALAHINALKLDLRRRFSGVPSSHLSEGIAAGFGFRTNAGLRSAIRSKHGQVLGIDLFDIRKCEDRLRGLGHRTRLDSLAPGQDYEVRLKHLAALRKASQDQFRVEEVARVQSQCALAFSERFNLGTLHTDARMVWRAGIDRTGNSDVPDGALFYLASPLFVGSGPQERVAFYRTLRSPSGMVRTIENAVALVVHHAVSSDWDESVWLPSLQREVRLAGWQLVQARGWSWGAGQEGGMVCLLQRTTSHTTLQRLWSKSFIHWLQVRQSRAVCNEFAEVAEVTQDFLSCPHFPLVFTTYDELDQRYLSQPRWSPVASGVQADVARYLINLWRRDVEEAHA